MARHDRAGDRAKTGATYLSLIVACLIALVPLVVIVMASFKTGTEFNQGQVLTPPKDWLNFDNFRRAFFEGQMLTAFVNTTFILVLSVTGTVLIGSMAAYAIDRFTFRGRGLILFLFLLAAIVPAVTAQVATFQIIKDSGCSTRAGRRSRSSSAPTSCRSTSSSSSCAASRGRSTRRRSWKAPRTSGSIARSSCRCWSRPS